MSRSTGTGSKLTGASETCAAGRAPEGGDQLTSRRAAKRRVSLRVGARLWAAPVPPGADAWPPEVSTSARGLPSA